MLTLCTGKHLILSGICIARQMSDIRNVHTTLHIISRISQILLQNILHHIAAEITDVGEMIYGRSTSVHLHLALFDRVERLHLLR